MKIEYEKDLIDTLNHSKNLRKIYKSWEKSKTGYKQPEKGSAYKNYLLICCYGKIENIFKNLLCDYFTKEGMPQRCTTFGYSLKNRLPGSLTKEQLHRFIKEECSINWFNELKNREKANYTCIKDPKLSFSDVFYAVDSLTNARHAFAHGDHPYTGSIDDIITYYKKAIVWLYEIDDIINTVN